MERFLCIHSHFYQPPRENPWLERIEIQDSAHPYHDWNERVTAECYAPNSASRFLDGEGRIIDIASNYERISFNFGPTLLSWMEKHSEETYAAILEADRRSIGLRSGHGNALAQAYNHLIMPLANSRDKRTQIHWGIKDFEHRFSRRPEGMWLPETAVDLETLEILAEGGIDFTILAPHQAAKVRSINTNEWTDVNGGQIDPARAYLCILPSGRHINLFFYDGPIAGAVAFEGLLTKGEDFIGRLLTGFSDLREWPQVLTIATDGESYGHHHKFGDMALAYALHHIESNGLARLTNYGEYLEKNPPSMEVQIYENTSWSCAHGIERWRSNCGCNTGGNRGWHQQWRGPLREALDWLRDEMSSLCEERTKEYLKDLWSARDEYIEVILDRSEGRIADFLSKYAVGRAVGPETTSIMKVMEALRHAMLMYTSCGWFFDELSGMETVQIIQYAGRTVQLARELFGVDLENSFMEGLSKASSNITEHKDGAHIYEKFVKPAIVDLKRVAAHYAISSLIKDYGDVEAVFSYSIKKEDYQRTQSGATKMALGRITVTSDITLDTETLCFCALYLGGHVFSAGIKTFPGEDGYDLMKKGIVPIFESGEIANVLRIMDGHFGLNTYSLIHLFRDEQRRILNLVLDETMENFKHTYSLLYENNRTLMAFLHEAGMPVPAAFSTAAAFTLNLDMKKTFFEKNIDSGKVKALLDEIRRWDVQLDSIDLEFILRRRGEDLIAELQRAPSDLSLLNNVQAMVGLLRSIPFEVNFWQIQNTYFKMAKTLYKEFALDALNGNKEAADWVETFKQTGDLLLFNTSALLSGELQEEIMERQNVPVPRIPVSTYRLQFNHRFKFSDAAVIVPYLHELGISDIYASPYLKARTGSLHGYDIVDPTTLNPEVGTEEEYEAFIGELSKYSMGQIIDIVPNHMSCETENPWWMDILENGPSSSYAEFFDINWDPPARKLSDRLLIPFLGDQYGKVLETQELKLTFEEGAFFIRYQEQKFPIVPETYIVILQHRLEDLQNLLPEENRHITELLSIITALKHLPSVSENDGEKIDERYREKEIIKKRLLSLYLESMEIRTFLDENISIFNGSKGDAKSFNLLDGLLAEQVWRLSYWRVAVDEINYRRFFDINNIAAIRIEDPAVFRETHKLILRLVKERKVTGLRVDHPDGLYDPSEYFERLQRSCFAQLAPAERPQADAYEQSDFDPDVLKRYEGLLSADPQYKPFYIVGEKILTKGEKMPEDWPILGTTGYIFLNSLNGIFVEPRNARMFDSLFVRFTGVKNNFSDMVYDRKKLLIQVAMSSEINTLGHYLSRISENNRHTRDFTLNSLTKVITEVIAFFPVYRVYTSSFTVTDRDRLYVETAVSKAKRKNPAISSSIFNFLEDVLLLRFPDEFSEDDKKEWLDFVMRFQQMTAPVMAKGAEDTALYVYTRLLSLNEVGGSPDRFGLSLEAFHGQNLDRLKFWPHALLTTSTHDTKRSEDVRARINVLSEVPGKWSQCLTSWGSLNKRKKTTIEGQPAPDRNEEYLLYQTLIGAWPLGHPDETQYDAFKMRIKDYMVKALREAKVNTSWINPNADYEEAMTSFIDAIMDVTPDNKFLGEFEPIQKTISYFGMLNSLSQTLLKIASPGVPDFYQGNETWDYSLVDPDNRRPVNFDIRREALAILKENTAKHEADFTGFLKELTDKWEDGSIKLYVTSKALAFRRENHLLFMEGAYIPLTGDGELADHFCGFARRQNDKTVLVIVPRLLTAVLNFSPEAPLGEKVWGNAGIVLPDEIPGNTFKNILTGEKVEVFLRSEKRELSLAGVFSSFPVVMLASEGL